MRKAEDCGTCRQRAVALDCRAARRAGSALFPGDFGCGLDSKGFFLQELSCALPSASAESANTNPARGLAESHRLNMTPVIDASYPLEALAVYCESRDTLRPRKAVLRAYAEPLLRQLEEEEALK